jgi:GTP cyclohydrolase I
VIARENNDFKARWQVDEQLSEQVENALSSLYESLEPNRLTPEDEFLQLFGKYLKQEGVKMRPDEVLSRWLMISKRHDFHIVH